MAKPHLRDQLEVAYPLTEGASILIWAICLAYFITVQCNVIKDLGIYNIIL